MEKEKAIITLVGEKQARVGFTFLFVEPLAKCEKCEYYRVCIASLEPKRIYRVVEVREGHFPCAIHEGGVMPAEVIEPAIDAVITSKTAILDSIITFHPQECKNKSCENNKFCSPLGIYDGDKCRVIQINGDVNCPLGRTLKRVLFKRLQ